MFDRSWDVANLDLGCKPAGPVEWVAVAPPLTERVKSHPGRRSTRSHRATARAARRAAHPRPDGVSGVSNAEQHQQHLEKELRRQQAARSSSPLPIPTALPHLQKSDCEDGEAADSNRLPPECDEGCVEYKLRIKDPNPLRFQQLVTQMKYRLSEGNGTCFYYIGVEDSGCPRDLRIAVAGGVDSGKSTLVAVLTHGSNGRPLLDNGRGSARMAVFRHKHEIETGRTSSLSQHILGFDARGGIINYGGVAAPAMADIAAEACKVLGFIDLGGHEKYLKTALYGMTCMLPDYVMLCHNAAMPTLSKVFREHLAAALALRIPMAVILTKVDAVPPGSVEVLVRVINDLLEDVAKAARITCGGPKFDPLAPLILSEAQVQDIAPLMQAGCSSAGQALNLVVPIFPLTGASVPAENGLSTPHPQETPDQAASAGKANTHFQVEQTFNVRGVGTVVSGTVVAGQISTGQTLKLGPTQSGGFADVTITGIQRSQVPVPNVGPGQHATLALANAATSKAPAANGFQPSNSASLDLDAHSLVNVTSSLPAWGLHPAAGAEALQWAGRSQSSPALLGSSPQNSRKGMVLLASHLQPQTAWTFTALLVLLSGHWPPRGLLSGCWPPGGVATDGLVTEDEADAEESSDARPEASPPRESLEGTPRGTLGGMTSPPGRSGGRERSGIPMRKIGCAYAPVVHCGSIRQAARVTAMQEVSRAELASPAHERAIGPALAAAAAILGCPDKLGARTGGPGCIASVTFRFVHRPEWLRTDACLLVRDRSDGCIAGAGFISSIP
ncbi:hypothetical protein WJX73_009078 [Symbiochloris irregularis]|uniref:Tr-type G domain-containing protein n=1 Tax=Symbiochloris irregularis TaxID=706552 RepID=A0AAW1P1Z6_9CHLO